jgi:CRISPR/Cas system CSM-associated protein Csm3 (group 7 of RAMP superfamily)
MRKLKCHEITGIIRCLSGLRIGGSDDLLKSGGADLTYIRHPVSLKPYIPGTSIKGKLRSELEQKKEKSHLMVNRVVVFRPIVSFAASLAPMLKLTTNSAPHGSLCGTLN